MMDSIIVSDEARQAAAATSLWDAAHTQALLDFHAAQTSDEQRAAFAVLESLSGRYCNDMQEAGYMSGERIVFLPGTSSDVPLQDRLDDIADDPGFVWDSMLARMRHEHKL